MDATFTDDIWFLTEEEKALIKGRKAEKQLDFAVLLKFFQKEGRFSAAITDIPARAIDYVSEQLNTVKNIPQSSYATVRPS